MEFLLCKHKLNSRNCDPPFYQFFYTLEYTGRNIRLCRKLQPCVNKIRPHFMPEIISTATIDGTKNFLCERFYLFKKFKMIQKLISALEIERNVRKDESCNTYMSVVGEIIFRGKSLDFFLITTKFHGPYICITLTGKSIG